MGHPDQLWGDFVPKAPRGGAAGDACLLPTGVTCWSAPLRPS